jgi:hypothetical protein
MSIDVNVTNDLVIVTETTEDIVVNVSNAAGPAGANGVGVPVGGATGQVLKKFTNTDYDTYWAADASGLTSVGLSMPTAFTVSNTPLTANGTLAVTGAGTAAQYVRGDGQLATFPSSASGGSSVNYYLNGSVNASVAGYKQLSNTATIGGGTDFTLTGNGLIAQFLTDVGNPNRIEIPGGAWNFEMFFQVSSSGGNQKFYVELLKYNGTTFTSIASSSAIPEEITGGTAIDLYLTSLAVPTTALLITDRLAIRVYIVDNAGGRTITLHTEDNTLCEIVTTFAGGIAALNGLSANTQYLAIGTSGTDFAISSLTDTHTFNLPTASATNRGALSSADWTTFSGKISGTGATGQVAYWNGTNSQTGSNNFAWDNTNNFLTVGGTTTSDSGNRFRFVGTSIRSIMGIYDTSKRGAYIGSASGFATLFGYDYTLGSAIKLLLQENGGNVSIGSTTDGGQRLQVYGDAFIKGSGATSATNALLVQNSAGTETFLVRNDAAIKIGSGSFGHPSSTRLQVNDISGNQVLRLDNTILQTPGTIINSGATGLIVNGNAALTLQAGNANNGNVTIGGNITNSVAYTNDTRDFVFLNQNWNAVVGTSNIIRNALTLNNNINYTNATGTNIARGLYINPVLTAVSDWRSIEWSNNSGWGLYGAGTANNYLAGKLLIGTTTVSTFALDVNGTARVSGISTLGSFRVGTTNASNAPFIFTFDSNAGSPDGSFRNLSFYNYTESAQANGGAFTFAGNIFTQTSGSQIFINTVNSFAPTSGTASLALLRLGWTINQTGGANGVTRGLYINPTLTSAADWRAIEVSAGVSVLAPSSTASATLRIPSGTAPTSPVNGDIWFDGTDLKMRIGGVTKTFTLV